MTGSRRGRKPKQEAPPTVPGEVAQISEEDLVPLNGLTDRALEIWDEELPRLKSVLITRSDVAVFSRYCQCVARLEELEDEAPHQAWTTEGAYGNTMENPFWKIMDRQDKMLLSIAKQLGMSPAARKTLNGGGSKTEAPAEAAAPKIPDEVRERRERLMAKNRS